MKKVYQVRYRGMDGRSGVMNAHTNQYNTYETKDEAIEGLKRAKEFHKETYYKNGGVEYTVVEIEYRESNVYRDRR